MKVVHIAPEKHRDLAFGVVAHALSFIVPLNIRVIIFELASVSLKAEGASDAEVQRLGEELADFLLPEREDGKYEAIKDNPRVAPLLAQLLEERFPGFLPTPKARSKKREPKPKLKSPTKGRLLPKRQARCGGHRQAARRD
jgi:hypothetical protein